MSSSETEERLTFVVDRNSAGRRLDKFLTDMVMDGGFTRAHIQHIIDAGSVQVNQLEQNKSYLIREGDVVGISIRPLREVEAVAQEISLDIVYEDEHLVVVNKAAGMVVHPSPGNWNYTLVNALLFHCKDSLSGINGHLRPGIVHRIDKETTGLLVVAKSDQAHNGLARQIRDHSFEREYRALCYGWFDEPFGFVDEPIGRDEKNRLRFCVTHNNSKHARTDYEVLEQFEDCALVRCILSTGRTHQIRVHMCHIGHPVVGDGTYRTGFCSYPADGQKLHAARLGFDHPLTGRHMVFESDPPQKFQDLLDRIRRNENG